MAGSDEPWATTATDEADSAAPVSADMPSAAGPGGSSASAESSAGSMGARSSQWRLYYSTMAVGQYSYEQLGEQVPLNDEPCAFDLLVYTNEDVDVPKAWEESDPKLIVESDEVKLRSFTTKVHRVDASVSYKATGGF